MGFKLFDVAKVGLYCETITHSTEKRKDGEVKVIQLSLRVQPFDAKLAVALHPDVRTTLFKLSHPDPQPHIARVNFLIGVPRQDLDIYATSETREPTRRLEHVKISHIYARSASGSQGYALVLKATFGPVSDAELGFCEAWRSGMKFVTCDEAEASDLFVEESEDDEDDEPSGQQALPDPEFETAPDGKPTDADTRLQDRLRLAGATITADIINAWSRQQAIEAMTWAEDQIKAHAKDKPGTQTSVKWPAHVAAACLSPGPSSTREPARHATPRHATRQAAAKAKQTKGRKRR